MGESPILAGLVAMFVGYLSGHEPPEVVWWTPSTVKESRLGEAECGYRVHKSANIKEPFCRIKINACLKDNPKELIDTYLHELAHYVDWVSDEEWDDHGGQWRKLVKTWDLVSHHATTSTVKGCEPSR